MQAVRRRKNKLLVEDRPTDRRVQKPVHRLRLIIFSPNRLPPLRVCPTRFNEGGLDDTAPVSPPNMMCRMAAGQFASGATRLYVLRQS